MIADPYDEWLSQEAAQPSTIRTMVLRVGTGGGLVREGETFYHFVDKKSGEAGRSVPRALTQEA